MRPQGHDIIRTWLFSTMTRSHHEFDAAPWKHAALSGWILDPDRKKMGKSSGNAQTPDGMLEQFGTDAVRYWAASGRPGVDTTFSEDQMKVGRKLANKLLNVTKFVLSFGDVDMSTPLADAVLDPIDRSMLAKLDAVIAEATTGFEAFDYARGLERTEIVLLVVLRQLRRTGEEPCVRVHGRRHRRSALRALREALSLDPASVRTDPAVRHRRGVELVERLERPRSAVAGRVRARWRRVARSTPRSTRSRSCAAPSPRRRSASVPMSIP